MSDADKKGELKMLLYEPFPQTTTTSTPSSRYYCASQERMCEYANSRGYCRHTGCLKWHKQFNNIAEERNSNADE